MSSLSTIAPRKLPVWRTVGACFATVARNFGQLLRITWLWLLIMLPAYAAVDWLIWWWTTVVGQQEEGIIAQAMTMLPNVIELPALASIAVAWHRLVLREERVSGAFYLRLDRAVWWYALFLFVFFAVSVGPIVSGAIPPIALPDNSDGLWAVLMSLGAIFYVAAGLAIALLVLPRVSLVLPAIALGEPLSLADAWRATRGNTWRLAWASLLCSLPPFVPFVPLFWYADLDARTASVIIGTIFSLAYVLIVTIAVTLLSLAYRYFVRQPHGDAETVA